MAACTRLIFNHSKNSVRCFSTTRINCGKRNVRKFPLFAFRWTKDFRERQKINPDPDIPVYKYGVRDTGYTLNGKFHEVQEMIPQIVVPDLTNFPLKPYVSYRAPNVIQTEFTAKDLFDAVYSRKIEDDYRFGKLDENGNPKEPNSAENLTEEEAKKLARQTGSDMFG